MNPLFPQLKSDLAKEIERLRDEAEDYRASVEDENGVDPAYWIGQQDSIEAIVKQIAELRQELENLCEQDSD